MAAENNARSCSLALLWLEAAGLGAHANAHTDADNHEDWDNDEDGEEPSSHAGGSFHGVFIVSIFSKDVH